jgi:serine/threonine protein kinase
MPASLQLENLNLDEIVQLCSQYTTDDTNVSAQDVLLRAKEVVSPPFRTFVQKASSVIWLARHVVANKDESRRLADRVARISFLVIVEANIAASDEAAANVRTCTTGLETEFVNAELLLGKFLSGKDLDKMTAIERFEITHPMYLSPSVRVFEDIHNSLTDILTMTFPPLVVQSCAAPARRDTDNAILKEVAGIVKEVDLLQQQMDPTMLVGLQQLKALLTSLSANHVRQLCEEFKEKDKDVEMCLTATTVAKVVLEKFVEAVVPKPFNSLVQLTLQVIHLAENAVMNTSECVALAARIARINFILLELTTMEGHTRGVLKCAEDLTEVFNSAVALLRDFQGGKELGRFARMKGFYQQYSSNTVEDFVSIHKKLDAIVPETHFVVTLELLRRLSRQSADIAKSVRDEMVHMLETVQWQAKGNKKGKKKKAVQQQLQEVLSSQPFRDLRAPEEMIEVCKVIIDKDTELYRSISSVVYAGKLYGQTEVAVKVVKIQDRNAFEQVRGEVRRAKRARHNNVVHIYGIVRFDYATAGIVMELLGESLQKATVRNLPTKMQYTLDIIAGMEHMHRDQSVVHLDLNSTNILLTQDTRHAKIIDFGLAGTTSTVRDPANGAFLAPELFGEALDPSMALHDVYSFAVVLAELWTGTSAWKGVPTPVIVSHVIAGRRPFSRKDLSEEGVPDPIIALIDACWAQEPERRPTFAALGQLQGVKISEWERFFSAGCTVERYAPA